MRLKVNSEWQIIFFESFYNFIIFANNSSVRHRFNRRNDGFVTIWLVYLTYYIFTILSTEFL
jgi:hypothetical protein